MSKIDLDFIEDTLITWSALAIMWAFASCLILAAIGLVMEIFK